MGDPKQELEKHLGELFAHVDPSIADEAKDDDDEEFEFDIPESDRARLSFKETLRATVWEFGGPSGVAKELKTTYDAAHEGSNTRASIVRTLFQNIQDYGEDMELGDEESIDALEDELRPIFVEEFLAKLPDDLREQVAPHLA